ncbi:MAG: hypothetical protein ACLR5H_05355 [Oscillospiraceae bacterium]
MRDLKHLIFMEDLLQEANNDLVKQAKAEGRRALGYTCNFMPEVLLDLAGCFSVRLRAPQRLAGHGHLLHVRPDLSLLAAA